MHCAINLEILMLRIPSLALIFALVPACTTPSSTTPAADELAGENGQDGEAAKADAAHDNFGYLALEKDGAFNCNNPLTCTPYKLTRPNRSSVTCNDNQLHPSCLVKAINFDKLGLSQDQQSTIANALQAEAADPTIGIQVLVKGQYKIYVDFLAFEASEVWMAQRADGTTTGTWVRVTDNGRRCIDTPCGSFDEERLNSNRAMRIDGLDFGTSYDDALATATYQQASSPAGAIVVGARTHGQLIRLPTTLRTVDQVFLPIAPSPAQH